MIICTKIQSKKRAISKPMCFTADKDINKVVTLFAVVAFVMIPEESWKKAK